MEFYAHNAASGQKLEPSYRDASSQEIAQVCESAAEAFPVYSQVPHSATAAFLAAIASEIEAASADIIAMAHVETGLPLPRLETEKNRTVMQLNSFAALAGDGSWVDARIDRALPDRKPSPRPDIRRMLRPMGPVAVFGASNFPLAFSVAGGDTASALAAGCPVVVKAHPAHPGTSELTAKAIVQAAARSGIPAGVFGMIQGAAPDVSLALVNNPLVSAVAFTGSNRAGRALFDAAARRPVPIPVFAEMGSVNPLYILPGALAESRIKIADDYTASFTMGVGQFCTKPGIAFGIASVEWDEFCARVAEKAAAVSGGVMLHAGIAASFKKGIAAVKDADWIAKTNAFVARTDAARFLQNPELGHEIFGPFTLLVTARSEAELLALAAVQEGQLTSTVFGAASDTGLARRLFEKLEHRAGRLLFNGFPTGVEVVAAMTHGGPYPASTDARFTSVGTAAIFRFARPVSYQNLPDDLLPPALQNANPLGISRLVDGVSTKEALGI